ncbi:hypothetical protein [Planctomicrobium piriforme]|uniref:DUF4386 family protein n=1 Tax=Planctomicrobium piriforme TaxID=1576369 RepID=A0A1I3E6M3_9PLAN|nr:hypothetical protein [Planctomicrobium piriforme]SFH94605.1 hypothetical protein SAMN05421753_104101 [Planctomicrobium piriforme]
MNMPSEESRQPPAAPRGIALSGILFSILFTSSLVLLRLAVPADPTDSGAWLASPRFRQLVGISLNLVPFAGIAFLWFMGVLRNLVGPLEDRFFATVFLGSGFLFVAMLFAAAGIARSLLDSFSTALPGHSETYRFGREAAYVLMNTFGMRMAAVFMFVTSTICLRTGVLSRPVSQTGFACGVLLLLGITVVPWVGLIFPLWVLLVSISMLLTPPVQRCTLNGERTEFSNSPPSIQDQPR